MNAREIRKLRRKFIWISMLSISLAVLMIGALINLYNYRTTRREIKWTLNSLIDQRGEVETDENTIRETFRNPTLPQLFSLSFQRSNYYLFFYDESGNITDVKTGGNGVSSTELAADYAASVLDRRINFGRLGLYYFQKRKLEDGQSVLALLDCETMISSRLRLIYFSISIACLGLLLTFFLVRAFSEKMIRPEIENSRRQEQFITNASHELKTPLAVIRANTEMEELLSGENEWTQSTLRQVDSLNGLIQNLVMISKSREQEDTAERTQIHVTETVSESVAPFEAMILQEGKHLEQKLGENIVLTADASKIRQLTTVLVDNAIKYCDENGTVRVELEPIRRGKGIQLTVSNSYKAGENVDYNRFFDRFYRQDASHNIDRGGYGIGLSIAESICEQHRGSIRAKWKNGEISFVCLLMEAK